VSDPGPPKVIVVGNLTLDDVVLPDGTTHMAAVGGNSLYATLGARLWEPSVGLVTRRGDDFPAAHLDQLAELGVDLAGVRDIAGPTVRNWVIYEEDGRRSWVYRTPAGRSGEVAVRPEDLPETWLTTTPPPVVHIAGMPLAAAEAIAARVRQRSPAAIITLDTHEDWVSGHQARLLALAGRVDVFLPSREELAALVGYDNPRRALAELADLPTPVIVIKMGPDGCLVGGRGVEQAVSVRASPGPVIDTTGAGDAFCGGVAAGLAAGLDPVQAARRGAVSAGFAVAGFSSMRLSSISPSDAEARLASAGPVVASIPPAGASATSARSGATSAGPTGPTTPAAARSPGGAADRRDISVMLEEIKTIPEVIANQLAAGTDDIALLSESLAEAGVEHVYIVGCGDSYFAGIGACLAFHKHAGLDAHAVHAMEMARYRVRYLPQASAVLAISYSGQVGRTIEAAIQARSFGHRVIALTGRRDGPLAAHADDCLPIDVPTSGYSPGTSTYVAMQAALHDLALRWGQARGVGSESARGALADVPALAAAAVTGSADPARAIAGRLIGRPWVSFVGAGPSEASARFGAAKLVESAQILGVGQNLEEWAHEEYFVSGKSTPVVVIAPTGAATDRANEILSELLYIGADAILISDQPPIDTAVAHLPLPRGCAEEFAPAVTAVPLSLLGCFLAAAMGKNSYNFPSEQAEQEHYQTIHRATRGVPA
jgi:sugar/nucleoside kinase (ribokinase family)/fructoselysine-6-P-deglycase FrlB-like protein